VFGALTTVVSPVFMLGALTAVLGPLTAALRVLTALLAFPTCVAGVLAALLFLMWHVLSPPSM